MIAVLQRVSSASVQVANAEVSRIGAGLVALVGALDGDRDADLEWLAGKIPHLRVFPDAQGKMNQSLTDVSGALLLVSQFTLAGDVRRGRRPSFTRAMAPSEAAPVLDRLAERIRDHGIVVQSGVFGASMQVSLVNDGPVTLVLDSREALGDPASRT